MAIALRYAARSDIGLGRYTNNQDSGYAGPHLLVIADGMGGHAGGDVASSVTVGAMVALDGESHGGDALALLARTLREANAELRRRTADDPSLAGMGTTTTALMRYGNKLALAHIGDSRAYLLRGGELARITHDHSFVQSLIDEGRITSEEAENHPQRSVVTRVLTGDPDDEPDLSVREARVGTLTAGREWMKPWRTSVNCILTRIRAPERRTPLSINSTTKHESMPCRPKIRSC